MSPFGLRRDEDGQALVEFALVSAFVLLPLLGGVVYLGGMVITQQNLTTAARHVARKAALDSQQKAFSSGTQSAATSGIRDTALRESGMGQASVKGVNWTALGAESGRPGSLKAVDSYTAELEWTSPLSVKTLEGEGSATAYTMGVGVLYHGATVERTYSELAPIGNLAGLFTPSVSATSVMATELAPRGDRRVKGLLDLNGWIGGIVNEPEPNLP